MDLEDLTKSELLAIAKMFGSDQVVNNMNKQTIISELKNDGVTYEAYRDILDQSEDKDDLMFDPTPVEEHSNEAPDEKKYLIKMTRPNHTYQIRGYQFTKQHPFALVTEEDANYLIEELTGFRTASPRELSEYYND